MLTFFLDFDDLVWGIVQRESKTVHYEAQKLQSSARYAITFLYIQHKPQIC